MKSGSAKKYTFLGGGGGNINLEKSRSDWVFLNVGLPKLVFQKKTVSKPDEKQEARRVAAAENNLGRGLACQCLKKTQHVSSTQGLGPLYKSLTIMRKT